MAEKLGELYYELKVKADQLESQLNAGKAKVQSFENSLRAASQTLLVAGGAITAFAVKGMHDFMSYADAVDDAVKITGIGAEKFQELAYAAQMEDVGMESLSRGLKFLTRNMADAKDAGSPTAKMFNALHIEVKNADGSLRNAGDVMLDVADRFAGMTNETDRSALALKVFDRFGTEMIPFLTEGRDQMEKYSVQAHELGMVLGEDSVKQGEALKKEWVSMQASLRGLGMDIAQTVVPIVKDLINFIKELAQWFKNLPEPIQKAIVIAGGLAVALGSVGLAAPKMISGITGIVNSLLSMNPVILGIMASLALLAVAFTAVAGKAKGFMDAVKAGDEYQKTLERISKSEKTSQGELEGALKTNEMYLKNLKDQIDALESKNNKTQVEKNQLGDLMFSFRQYSQQHGELKTKIEEVTIATDDGTKSDIDYSKVLGDGTTKVGERARTLTELVDAMRSEAEAMRNNIVLQKILNDLGLQANDLAKMDLGTLDLIKVLVDEKIWRLDEERISWEKLNEPVATYRLHLRDMSDLTPQFNTQMQELAQTMNNLAPKITFGDRLHKDLTGLQADMKSVFDTFPEFGNVIQGLGEQMGSMLMTGKANWKEFGESAIQMLLNLIAKLLVTLTIAAMLAILTGGGFAAAMGTASAMTGMGGLGKLFGGYDDPLNDARAGRWGRDFGRLFSQGIEQGAAQNQNVNVQAGPVTVMPQIRIITRDPDTMVELFDRMSSGAKDSLYRRIIKPAQMRHETL